MCTFGTREVWQVTTRADVAGNLNDTSYHFSIAGVRHYVWYNINTAGVDPDHYGETAHVVAGATGVNAATLAAATQVVVDAINGISSSNVTDTNTDVVDTVGNVTDVADDGTDPTGFTLTKTTEGAESHAGSVITEIIATLLEARFVYFDDLDKTPLSERGELEIPHLKMIKYAYLRSDLEDLKGQIPSVATADPPAFNFDLDTVEGGYDY